MSICSMEEVAAASDGPRWFQLYVWRDRDFVRGLIERAKAAGYTALVITVDTPVLGQREKDLRNGLTLPPRITARNVLDVIRRTSWLKATLSNPRPTFGNFVGTAGVEHDAVSLAGFTTKQFSPSITWKELEWYRSVWDGPIAIKGIMDAEDAKIAVQHGIEAIIVSNHGGRQLDSLPSPIAVLPEIVDAVNGRAEVILDGGVRRGTDVVKALALGAKACMIGKAFNYAVAAQGEQGVDKAIKILKAEIDRTLALIGRPTLAELDRSAVRARAAQPVPIPSR
jgi:L-lactate dehydrogenase (cytochrome)